jgi:cellulose synthase/poly-beta-1,6-N-acetylglucosamine synthase-like glycosyltransferase
LDIISQYIAKRDNLLLVDAVGYGKKNALKEGIDASIGYLLVCTDADCVPHPQWIETIVGFYSANPSDMIIAPVVMTYNNTTFQQIQALEFMSLQAATAGAACAGFPVMCNGANLTFTREAWNINNANLKNEKLSGDDMFLMMSIKKQKGKISYLKSDKSVVFTMPCTNVADFLNQRKRWVSKSSAYYDKSVILSALTVLAISVVIVLNLILAIIVDASYWIPLAFIFLIKIITDRVLLFSFGKFVRSVQLLRWIFPLSVIYPFYVLYATIAGLFGSFNWKGRNS